MQSHMGEMRKVSGYDMRSWTGWLELQAMSAVLKENPNLKPLIESEIPWLHEATMREACEWYQWSMHQPGWTDELTAELGRRDRFFLLTHLLRRPDAVHPWLYDRCREVESDPDGHLDLWARIHYKSTIITFAGSVQEILNDKEITIGIFSHTRPIAKSFLAQIKTEFEDNLLIKKIYPDVLWQDPQRQAPKWSVDDGIVVRRDTNPREATIEAWGMVDGQPVSKHFKLLIPDDVVTEASVNTPEQILKTTEAWERLQFLGTSEPRIWHIGTRYHFGDTYGQLIERDAVKVRVYPATDDGTPDGKPVFLSQATWDKLKKDTSNRTIATQMLQNPIAGSEQEMLPDWLRKYEIRPRTLNIYILGDYAGSRKSTGSSSTALIVLGVDAQLNKYLLDGACHKMGLEERWTRLRDFRRKWLKEPGIQVVEVGYERFGAQSDIEHFETMMRLEGEAFPIQELAWPSDGDYPKDNRIRRLIPDLKNWRFFFPYVGEVTKLQRDAMRRGEEYLLSRPIRTKNHEGKLYDLMEYFVKNEYVFFPATTKKDMLDAMSRVYDMSINPPFIHTEQDIMPEVTND